MTTVQEPTTTPEVPAWLNLDALDPDGVRVEIARLRAEALELHDKVITFAFAARDAHQRAEKLIEAASAAVGGFLAEQDDVVDDYDYEDGVVALAAYSLGSKQLHTVITMMARALEMYDIPVPRNAQEVQS